MSRVAFLHPLNYTSSLWDPSQQEGIIKNVHVNIKIVRQHYLFKKKVSSTVTLLRKYSDNGHVFFEKYLLDE